MTAHIIRDIAKKHTGPLDDVFWALRLLLLRHLDGPQGFIVRDLIKMHPSLFKDGALGKHGGQGVHLFGCVEIRPDTHIDDSMSDRVNGCMVVEEATQLLERGNQRFRRCLNEAVYLVVLWRGEVSLRNAYDWIGGHRSFSCSLHGQHERKRILRLQYSTMSCSVRQAFFRSEERRV